MKYIIVLIISLLTTTSAFSFVNSSFLKGGGSYALEKMKAMVGTEDETHNLGINTSYGYKWNKSELYFASSIYFGKIEDLSFNAAGNSYTGSGDFKSVSVRPTYKYILDLKLNKVWNFYLSIGPQWSIQTVKFANFTTSNNNAINDFKLSFESFGAAIGFGIEEQLQYKEMHPVYLEVVFIRRSPYKVSVVDVSNKAEINILTTNDIKSEMIEDIILVNIGVTVF